MIRHGPIKCARCWPNDATMKQERGPFRLVRDPGHWGASNPHTLVLGISKGNTQSEAFRTAAFDSVAFKGIRHRILQLFKSIGLLPSETARDFERRFSATEQDYAFASVVRCSITGLDRRKQTHTADSPNVVPAFRCGSAGLDFVQNCIDKHLVDLPNRTRLVLLFGNSDAYVDALRKIISRRRGELTPINPMAYLSKGVRFIHLAHPSKGNGHFGHFVNGEGKPGEKRKWAQQALEGEA